MNAALSGSVTRKGDQSGDDSGRRDRSTWMRRATRLAICVFGLALLGLAPAALAMTPARKAACDTVLTLRGWHPPLALAGDVPETQAVSLLRDHLNWQRNVVTATRLDPDVDAVRAALWDAVRDFNLSGLYRTLPTEDGDWRALTLQGRPASSAYRVSRIAPDAFDQPLGALGETTSQLSMRPGVVPPEGPAGDRYKVRARMRADIGPIEWANVLEAAWMSLDHLTTTAPLPAPSGGGFFGGTGSDAEILLQLQPAFPNFFRWYLGISNIPDILAPDSARSPAEHLHLVVQLDQGLREHYPRVADYLEQIKGFISAQVSIENDAGRWLDIDLDSVQQRLVVDAWVKDGHLVPSRDGTPRLDAIDPAETLDHLSYQSVADIKLKALGVTVRLDQWPIDWTYRRSNDGATYDGRIVTQPKVSVGGAALGFIPTGVVDAVIPNNIEGIVNDFMQVLTQSNGGAGAKLDVSFEQVSQDSSLLSVAADGDMLDNFFVRFAVSLINKRVLPDSAQVEGLKRLIGAGLDALTDDLDILVAAQHGMRGAGLTELVAQCRDASSTW
ncbi:hypothetical protein [Salinisphaera sp. T31B1]|uniref:hypothetical protein n=1 Tax=Salinisphaera sp. T31B1 TaxID=727963 RepID=UPI00333EEC2B